MNLLTHSTQTSNGFDLPLTVNGIAFSIKGAVDLENRIVVAHITPVNPQDVTQGKIQTVLNEADKILNSQRPDYSICIDYHSSGELDFD